MVSPYSKQFYEYQSTGSLRSAEAVVPIVLEFVQPKSVADLGCGIGTWLSVFKRYGVTDVLGVDGAHVDTKMLKISPAEFSPQDISREIEIERKFDLAMSLEAAEHIEAAAAARFVEALTALAPVVLFSAAIPHQGGAHHVNEQWPEYWREHFEKHDFVAVDCLRGRIWHNDGIQVWYRQNMMFFINRARLQSYPLLKQACDAGQHFPLSLVHPDYYLERSKLALETPARAFFQKYRDVFIEGLKKALPDSIVQYLRRMRAALFGARRA